MGRRTDSLARALNARLRDAKLEPEKVAAFTGAEYSTVVGWAQSDNPARGLMLNRLHILLVTLGLAAPEFYGTVSAYGRYLARLLGFRLITLEEAQAFLGGVYLQAVFKTIRGERDPYEKGAQEPTTQLGDLMEQYGRELTSREEKIRTGFHEMSVLDVKRIIGIAEASPATTSPVTAMTQAAINTGMDHGGYIALVASKLGEVRPLAQYLLDECSPEDRARVRELLGEEGMFDLSNLFNALCSERARDAYLGR